MGFSPGAKSLDTLIKLDVKPSEWVEYNEGDGI